MHRLSAETIKRSGGVGVKYEDEGTSSSKRNRVQSRGREGQSYEPPTYFNYGAFRSNNVSLNQDDAEYIYDFNDCEVRAQDEDEAEEIEEEVEEEEEPLLIPERHIAICNEYRSRQCKVEALSEVSGEVDDLKQLQYPFRPEVDRRSAQKGGPAVVASSLRTRYLSVEAPEVLSPQNDKCKAIPYTPSSASKEGGITTTGGDRPQEQEQEQEQEPFREKTTSLTVPAPSLPLSTTVHVESEVGTASVGLRMEVSLSPSFADTTGTHDADLAERNEILVVKNLGPSANATDGPAMSFMSSVMSVSPDWPPPNQLAGHQLQIESIAEMQHDYFLYGISGNEKYDAPAIGVGCAINQCSSQSASFFTDVYVETDINCSLTKEPLPSPVLLPSDPEDTSVLEPICSLDGMGLLYESSTKAQGQSDLNPSPSEWIGSDDWVEE
ncbi:hypothetical protein EMPS_07220 [Entomortierella parvispora]|uniref:Uncharacterized protein n=1 Tax=Entomortierella parvispora TaxID=205924 RepID=A0A9P3HDY1_9FUNG|nr:hypothetical protein EMPS_07220 [Entomortierella parvispora]